MSLMKSRPIHRNSSESPKYAKRWKEIPGNIPTFVDQLLLFEYDDQTCTANYISIAYKNLKGEWIDSHGEAHENNPVRYDPNGLDVFDR